MNKEIWIWTELLAFDRTQKDFGVADYLKQMKEIPTGISILSGFDFILCHDDLAQEAAMPHNVCSRCDHLSNGMRERQDWTNFEIRALVQELKKSNIKVLISVFEFGNPATYHEEFRYKNCPEHYYAFPGKLNDGRNAGDFFTEKLMKVIQDYGFDGWHAADGIAAGWQIVSDPTDAIIRDFAQGHRELGLPEFLQEDASQDNAKRLAKLHYLQKFCWKVWNDHMLNKWMTFWQKAVQSLHNAGKLIMVNSPNTKSIFGALQYMSIDYRKLAELKIDYLLCETTTAACALIWHGRNYIHEANAVIAEMTAAMPGVKILIMPAVKDVVETYDALAHAPALYERDLYWQTAQHILRNGRLKRCADGLMICLGDCIEAHEWKMLDDLYERAFRFQAVKSGEMVWLHDSEMFDALQAEHHRFGTWSPAQQINELRNLRSIDVSTIADVSGLAGITQPVIACDFHLWSQAKQQAVLSSQLPMVLTGCFDEHELPPDAEVIRWTHETYHWCAVFRNWQGMIPGVADVPPGPALKPFDDSVQFELYRGFYPHLAIPQNFWQAVADRMRALLGKLPLKNEEDGIQLARQYAADGTELVLLNSNREHYTIPDYELSGTEEAISTLSRFPKVPLAVRAGRLGIQDPAQRFPLHIPPRGVLAFTRKNK